MQIPVSSPSQFVVSKLHELENGAPIVRLQVHDPVSSQVVIIEMPGFVAESLGKTLHALGA